MNKYKVIYMGTPSFAIPALEALAKEQEVVLVVSQEDRRRGRGKEMQATEVKEKALELGLEVYQPKNINSKEAIDKLKAYEVDFIVVAAYGQILGKEILDLAKFKCINIHGSLLPKYRGAAPINYALIEGEEETGITIMEMEEGLDTGDMYYKSSLPILKEDDSISLYNKLAELGGQIINPVLDKIANRELLAIKQDESKASYANKLNKQLGRIDWTKSSREINNLVRALKPWPSSYSYYLGQEFKIHETDYSEEERLGEFGEILKVSKYGIEVKTDGGFLIIKELQFPNKRKMKVEDYIRGNKIEVGVVLGK